MIVFEGLSSSPKQIELKKTNLEKFYEFSLISPPFFLQCDEIECCFH